MRRVHLLEFWGMGHIRSDCGRSVRGGRHERGQSGLCFSATPSPWFLRATVRVDREKTRGTSSPFSLKRLRPSVPNRNWRTDPAQGGLGKLWGTWGWRMWHGYCWSRKIGRAAPVTAGSW